MICAHCGDILLKKPILNVRRFFGFVSALAFLTPLLIFSSFVIKDFTEEKIQINSESLVFMHIN